MENFYIFICVLNGLILSVSMETLQCYECEDCPLPDTSNLKYCTSTTTTTEETSSDDTDATSEPTTPSSTPTDESTDETGNVQRTNGLTHNDTFDSNTCLCNDDACDCSRDNLQRADDVLFQCYKYIHKENNVVVIDRGCKEVSTGYTACSLLNVSEDDDCTECETDKCNTAVTLKISIILFLFSIGIFYF